MRLPYLLAAGAALGAADDGAPRAQTQGKERNPPAWPAAVRVVGVGYAGPWAQGGIWPHTLA